MITGKAVQDGRRGARYVQRLLLAVTWCGSTTLLLQAMAAPATGADVASPDTLRRECEESRLVTGIGDLSLRERVVRACAASPTLREVVAALDRRADLAILLHVAPLGRAEHDGSFRGSTRWRSTPVAVLGADGSWRWSGAIQCRVAAAHRWEAVLGHELYHALELARLGDIRKSTGAYPVRNDRSNHYFETPGARAVEHAVLRELAARH